MVLRVHVYHTAPFDEIEHTFASCVELGSEERLARWTRWMSRGDASASLVANPKPPTLTRHA
jgi:hypothetical protein